MGAKWGFHKFPLDPDRVHPPTPDELSWRALTAQTASHIEAPYRLDIAFDLSLPLTPQLDATRFRLVSRIAELRWSGHAAPRSVASQRNHWTRLLMLLDGTSSGLKEPTHLALLDEARAMTEGAYREILRLAE